MQFPEQPLDVLVVAPHPDDAEISVGGTIMASLADGLTVGVLELTNGEPTPHGSPEIRAQETAAASKALGLTWRGNLGLINRSVVADLDSRRKLAEAFRQIRPNTILAPYWQDAHPDHVAASQLVDDARFWSKLSRSDLAGERFWPPNLFYFFSIHLRIHPKASFVIDITQHIDARMKSIECFDSQVRQGRADEFPTLLDDIRDRARYWGWTIGAAYGEPFACREEVGIKSLRAVT